MDPREIVPAKLSMSQIRDIAEDFRNEHIFNDALPVDIELIVEATMGIRIIPVESLPKNCDMEGFISKDFKSIYVDTDLYMDDRYYKRVRFTIAHEIGHLILHRDTINLVRFLSEDEWKNFRMNLNDKSLAWFETQASEFAGRILVPLDPLIINFKKARNETVKMNSGWDSPKIEEEELFATHAQIRAPKFGVSVDVIEKRLRKENIMALLGK